MKAIYALQISPETKAHVLHKKSYQRPKKFDSKTRPHGNFIEVEKLNVAVPIKRTQVFQIYYNFWNLKIFSLTEFYVARSPHTHFLIGRRSNRSTSIFIRTKALTKNFNRWKSF